MTDTHQWVLSVDKKVPSSISLSLPVMNAARWDTDDGDNVEGDGDDDNDDDHMIWILSVLHLPLYH